MVKISPKKIVSSVKKRVAKVKWAPILIGVGVAGTAAILLYNAIRKGTKLAIFYVSDDDLGAAQIVKNAIPESVLIKGEKIEAGDTSADIGVKVANALTSLKNYDLTISIGGQLTNPIYNYAALEGLISPLLRSGDKEVKRLVISGKDIILAAGYDAIDTVNAVNEAIAMIK